MTVCERATVCACVCACVQIDVTLLEDASFLATYSFNMLLTHVFAGPGGRLSPGVRSGLGKQAVSPSPEHL